MKEKKKPIKYKLYIVIFLIICLIPCCLMPIWQSPVKAENRVLAKKPSLFLNRELNINYPNDFDNYIKDHFNFRQELISLNGIIQSSVFSVSSEESVIVGTNDWLFYTETLDDYLGTELLSERGIQRIKISLELIDSYLSNRDVLFIFTIAPNKNSIYPEYMPSRYSVVSSTNNATKLTDLLSKRSKLSYVDLFSVLREQKNNGIINYHKTDSHWNNLGALSVYNALMEVIKGFDNNFDYDTYSNADSRIVQDWQGDLMQMLIPTWGQSDVQHYFDIDQEYEYTSQFRSSEDIFIETSNDMGSLNALIFRDSFGNALLPFVAQPFKTSYFSRSIPYDMMHVEENDIDIVIMEIAERNIPNIIKNMPLMYAEEIIFDQEAQTISSSNNQIFLSSNENDLTIYGILDPSMIKNESRIFLKLINENESIVYEAFPILDESLTDEYDPNLGFSIIIETESLQSGTYDIEILSINDTINYSTGPITQYVIK